MGAVCAGRTVQVVRYLITSVYVAGGLAFLFALVVILASASEDSSPVGWLQHLAAALLAPIYSVLASEGVLRPLKQRLETTAKVGAE